MVYVIAAEGGHVRVGASSRPDDDLRRLRRTFGMEFDLAYRSRPTSHAVDVARGARDLLAGVRVCDGWWDATAATAVAAIERAGADLGVRL